MTAVPGRTVALYERILEAVPGGVVYVGHDGTLLLANQPAQEFLGLRLDESTNRYIVDFAGETYHDDGSICPVEDYPVTRCLVTQEPQPPRVIGVRQPIGEVRWAVFTALPFDPGDGQPSGAVVSFVDITERKRAEAQVRVLQAELAQRERLATVGTLAAAVAHEVNNPLAYIFLGLESVREQLEQSDAEAHAPLIAEMNEIQHGAGRVRDIVRDLMTFAKIRDRSDAATPITDAIEAAARMAAPEVRYRATLSLDLQARGTLQAAAGRLSQVVLNLVLNAGRSFVQPAVDASIVVTSRDVEDTVVIEVADNGPGVDARIADKIFDPFFTTNRDGTGLGLSISRSLVEEMGGRLELLRDENPGTRFRVTLPQPNAVRKAPRSQPNLAPEDHLYSILFVDDEEVIRRLARAALMPLHRVTVADSVAEALATLSAEHFDLVVCDTMLLDGSGVDVFEWLNQNRPSMTSRFLFITGGAFTTEVEEFFAANDVPILAKPFDRTQLNRSIEAVLTHTPVEFQ